MCESTISSQGVIELPKPSNIRIMMMPFMFRDVRGSLPGNLQAWVGPLEEMIGDRESELDVAYLTIDEAFVKRGEHHRRPGLHVDGAGGWGGGTWGTSGMLVTASHFACRAWNQDFEGEVGDEGDCEHLRPQLREDAIIDLIPGQFFHLNRTAVHETFVMPEDALRQFVRISEPNDSPWFANYTPNPTGVEPLGEILPSREKEMGYRPC